MVTHIIKHSEPPAVVFIAGAVLCTLCYTTMAILSHGDSEINLLLFLGLSALCAIASAITVLVYQQHGRQISFGWIIVSAIAFRTIGVFGQPMLEDDFYRYLWDGYQMITGGNPYPLAPSAFFADTAVPAALEEVLSRVNYPDVATVYGPVCQWLFAAAYLLDPGSIWPLQIISALADIAIILLLWSIRQNNFILLYAWSPLLIKEFAFTAHTDIIAVFFAIAALKCQKCNRPWLTGALLAMATGTKVFALLLLPFLLFRRGNTRFLLYGLLGFAMVIGLITWSFGTTLIWFPEGLKVMANAWLFNAPVYLLLVNQLNFELLKLLLLALFMIFAAGHFNNVNGFTKLTTNDRVPAWFCRW